VCHHALFHLSSFCCDHHETIRLGDVLGHGRSRSFDPQSGSLIKVLEFK
jgi:hypothetical protein